MFGAFGAKWTSTFLGKIGDSLTHGKPLTSKVKGLRASTLRALDKNLRRANCESIPAYMRPSRTVKASSILKGAPLRARARANAATPSAHARVRLFISGPSSFPTPLSWGAGGGAQRDGGARGCADGGGVRGGGARGGTTGGSARGGDRGGDHGGHGGPADGGARLRSFRRDFPFLDFGFCFLC